MGSRSMDSTDWTKYTATSAVYRAAPTAAAAFKAREMDPYLDPKLFSVRESRNSSANPQSTPIILGLDVTGSMGAIAKQIAGEGLGILIKEIFDRKPVSDPHIMFMAIGDVIHDQAPLQVSQFEADMTMLDQLGKIWVESGGGGNSWESYNLPWHFANFHTSCDAFEKDDRKGYIFTFGDEETPMDLTQDQLRKVYDNGDEIVATNAQLLDLLSSKYHVFHLIVEQGSHCVHHPGRSKQAWTELLGQRAISLTDSTKLAEVIVSVMQVTAGADAKDVIKSWSGGTAVAVSSAIRDLAAGVKPSDALVRF